ncbi:MAG: hypothetical protein BSK19_09595 [Stenotrophomonas maltophilia]|nr:MAG: hypothetical protein BSK19_09595 [Stenotrophomonas maltophilia]
MMARPARSALGSLRRARWLALLGVLASPWASAQGPACKVMTEEHGLWMLPGCEVVDDKPQISAETLQDLPYDGDGLALVQTADGFHYVDRHGRSQAVIAWDNGADPLQEGLFRGRIGDRVGYFNAAFEQVIAATFDFAWPFQDGVAEVCNGCRRGTPDGDGHTPMEGGEWFRIDRSGRRVK